MACDVRCLVNISLLLSLPVQYSCVQHQRRPNSNDQPCLAKVDVKPLFYYIHYMGDCVMEILSWLRSLLNYSRFLEVAQPRLKRGPKVWRSWNHKSSVNLGDNEFPFSGYLSFGNCPILGGQLCTFKKRLGNTGFSQVSLASSIHRKNSQQYQKSMYC